ncbi:MAG: hypothetical protein ACPIA2_12470, partial [Mariniblastus sp.]
FTFICMLALSIASKSDSGEKGTNQAADMVAQEGDADEKAKDIEVITKVDGDGKETIQKGDEVVVFPVTVQTIKFQVILMVCACHYSMILTNWGDPIINNVKTDFFSLNWQSCDTIPQHLCVLLPSITRFRLDGIELLRNRNPDVVRKQPGNHVPTPVLRHH